MKNGNEPAEQIRQYLQAHPGASDTLEGITAWWLLRHRIDISLTEVQQAVNKLVAEGVIKESEGQDGRTVYALRDGGK